MSRRLVVLLALLLACPVGFFASSDFRAADAGDLADTHRTGTVLAVQGAAYVRPGGHRRWTPLLADAVLLPGDLVKTQTRGAHALEVALDPAGGLLMGPGVRVEMPAPGRLTLLCGDVEVVGTPEAPVTVTGPGNFTLEVAGTAWLSSDGTAVEALEQAPRWLESYRASAGDEWMGSLLANVDGRNVPLAVGYHKVTVDVRDQIARTTVDQSFVNSTDARLEGVFYFPLPADASISGFAMWIGGELVEADVVEKARARQIYEDILRRKKDPGLLEWQGGNLFKARVFPIEPNSEKRVRVRYTQVLRVEGDTWRYRYALRSDLLRSKPLRRLDVQVNVLSSRRITQIASPSHACRVTNTGTEARVEFSAEEYVPTRDLEVAVTLEPTVGVQAIAHRRGDDGFFMLLLTPPDAEAGGWTRRLMPEGKPLDVVVVADTSGSMDQAARNAQAAFVEALLALLGEDDRFRLAAADVDLQWAFDGSRPADAASTAAALTFLGTRTSLGWTDLDGALASALAAAGDDSLVVYVGDGIPTTGDADPSAQADRIRAKFSASGATVHAVSTSSTYEQPVLEALASIGGGSVRRADGDPSAAAHALLAEAARPVLKDLRVDITGIATARVYPEALPNLALGSQQVVLGRFLPKPEAQRGQIVVKGRLGDEHVYFMTALEVPAAGDDDEGNSFLPRLWARKHLDALLQRGPSAAVKEEIVAFSAEYGILTPYTSLLVLESDEDRARYGVTRTVKMRDGEAFFAEGRDRVQLELAREQARIARAWRASLQRRMLAEIQGLGRDLLPDRLAATQSTALGEELLRGDVSSAAGVPVERLRSLERKLGKAAGGRRREGDSSNGWGAPEPVIKDAEILDHLETDNDLPLFATEARESGEQANDDFIPPSIRTPATIRLTSPRMVADDEAPLFGAETRARSSKKRSRRKAEAPAGGPAQSGGYTLEGMLDEKRGEFLGRGGRRNLTSTTLGLSALGFPALPPARTDLPDLPPAPFSQEVRALLASLDRRAALAALPGGIDVRVTSATVHAVRGDVLSLSSERVLAGQSGWYLRDERAHAERIEAWADGTHRATLDTFRGLGRRRAFHARDAQDVPAAAAGIPTDDLESLLRRSRVRVLDRRGDRARIVIEGSTFARVDRHLLIDAKRGVIVEERLVLDDVTVQRVRHSGFVEVAGLWWARLTETFDVFDRKRAFTTKEVRALDSDAFAEAFAAATRPAPDALFLDGDMPRLEDAVQAIHEERATFADHLLVALRHATKRQWDEAFAAWSKARAIAGDGSGTTWIDLALNARARRDPALLVRAQAALGADGAEPAMAAWWASALTDLVKQRVGPNEHVAFLDLARTDWTATGEASRERAWIAAKAAALDAAGRYADARAARTRAAALWPHDLQSLYAHVADLISAGDTASAVEILSAAVAPRDDEVFTAEERDGLFGQLTALLWKKRALDRLEQTCRSWSESTPRSTQPWSKILALSLLRGNVETVDPAVEALLGWSVPTDRRSTERAQLSAAVAYAIGGGGGWFSQQGMQPVFVPLLVDLGRRIARFDVPDRDLLRQILGSRPFNDSDGRRLLMAALLEDLSADDAVETMSARRLALYGGTLSWAPGAVENAVFDPLAARLRARFDALEAGRERDTVANVLLHMLDQRGDPSPPAAFLRHWAESEEGYRATERWAVYFDRVLTLQHSLEREAEAFGLLPRILHPHAPNGWAHAAATAVRRLAKWGYLGRQKAALGSPEDQAKRSRAESNAHAKQATRVARTGLAASFQEAESLADDLWRPWFQVEALAYLAELGDDLAALEGPAFELLDMVSQTSSEHLDHVLTQRALLVLGYAATRRNAPDGLADRLLAWLDERAADETDKRLDWRYEIFRLLIALDRSEEVETTLEAWIRPKQVRSAWRVALALLRAETGRLDEAASLFEEVAARDELSAGNWRRLAAWYLALGDDARREQALEGCMRASSESDLSSLLWSALSRVQQRRGGVPGDLEVEDLRALRWILRKASRPSGYMWQVKRIYNATKDHRVLACIAEGLPGHTPEGVYAFLENVASLVQGIHEEATVDAALEALRATRAPLDAEHDRRALTLLEGLLASRAALVPKADPKHTEAALTAFAEVEAGTFVEGEAWRIARVVAAGAPVKHPELAKARLGLARALHASLPPGTRERLLAADACARILWAHNEFESALDIWSTALDETRSDGDAPTPEFAREIFGNYIDRLATRKNVRRAETLLEREIAATLLDSVRQDYLQRLYRLYAQAIEAGGTLSIGSGEALLDEAATRVDRAIEEGPTPRASTTSNLFVGLYRAAHKARVVPNVGARLETWARVRLPRVFARLMLESTTMVRNASRGIASISGPRPALVYALDRCDSEPPHLARLGLDLWSNAHWDLSQWRRDGKPLEDADAARLLKRVVASLERHLLDRSRNARGFWDPDYDRYWKAKRESFRATAHRIVELNPENITAQYRCASYLREIHFPRDAVEVLVMLDAWERADLSHRALLARWLVADKRYGEANPLLGELIGVWQDLDVYLLRASALGGLERVDDALEALRAGEAWAKGREAWSYGPAQRLGEAALGLKRYEAANAWLEEAATLRLASRGGRSGNDSTLGSIYSLLARARVALGRTDDAVEAASAGVVAWGHNQRRRQAALDALRKVLAAADDLDAWVETYEGRVAETGLEAPLIRTTLATVYVGKGLHAKAVDHLLAAREVAPEDPAVHTALVAAYDALGREPDAIDALLASLRMAPRNLDAAADLARRFEQAGRKADARRARANLVEPLPHEADGHRRLAVLLDADEAGEEAEIQWAQVVRTDPLDPTGWLGLAKARIVLGRTAKAREALEHVLAKDWEKRFGDVKVQAAKLLADLD